MASLTASDTGLRARGGDLVIVLVIGGLLAALWMIHPKAAFSIGR
jgi:hypothetical protein